MKKSVLIILLILLIIATFLFFNQKNDEKVCFSKKCFNVEVVDSYEERQRGLMFRESLDEDRGMLFVFESEGNYPFWMKNTLIPLDMIWISQSGEVVDIVHQSQPCKSDPCLIINHQGLAKYVIEINAGLATKYEISVGEIVKFVDIKNE